MSHILDMAQRCTSARRGGPRTMSATPHKSVLENRCSDEEDLSAVGRRANMGAKLRRNGSRPARSSFVHCLSNEAGSGSITNGRIVTKELRDNPDPLLLFLVDTIENARWVT